MPRPRSLSQTDLAAAALAVIDRDGLAGMSMRSVAHQLRMGTMSLYRYVTDRGQLEGLVVELVLAGVDTTVPSDGSWQQRITVLVERVRDAVGAHPEMVPLTVRHRHASAALARWSEAVLAVLTEAGCAGPRRVIALRSLISYVIGAIQLEHLGPLSGAGTVVLADLPDDRFPLLAETARGAGGITPADEFRGGLDVLLAGLDTAPSSVD
jgi:AcrR family transcriptional regulator